MANSVDMDYDEESPITSSSSQQDQLMTLEIPSSSTIVLSSVHEDSSTSSTHKTLHRGSSKSSSSNQSQDHIRIILEAALPTGTVVSEETLERLSSTLLSLINETSEATVRKFISSSGSGSAKRVSKSKSSQKSKSSTGVRSPATIKKSAAKARTSSRGGSIKVQKVVPKKSSAKSKKEDAVEEEEEKEEREEEEEEEEEEEKEEEEEEYEVESILAHRNRSGKLQFLLKWKGFPKSESTWEEKEALDGCQVMLNDYIKKENLSL
ncbi:hypothetical protein BGZ49_007897 [Haplosporangium sp. Z 27]|nr:hypothetical protein BGZ49_007897 [Haplosporangium sp. Z 27]